MRICQAPAGQLAQGSAFTCCLRPRRTRRPPAQARRPLLILPARPVLTVAETPASMVPTAMFGPTMSPEKITMPFTDAGHLTAADGQRRGKSHVRPFVACQAHQAIAFDRERKRIVIPVSEVGEPVSVEIEGLWRRERIGAGKRQG